MARLARVGFFLTRGRLFSAVDRTSGGKIIVEQSFFVDFLLLDELLGRNELGGLFLLFSCLLFFDAHYFVDQTWERANRAQMFGHRS